MALPAFMLHCRAVSRLSSSATHSKRRGSRRSRLCLLGAPPGGPSSGLRGCLAAPLACSFLSRPSTLTFTTPMTTKPEHSREAGTGV